MIFILILFLFEGFDLLLNDLEIISKNIKMMPDGAHLVFAFTFSEGFMSTVCRKLVSSRNFYFCSIDVRVYFVLDIK